MVCQRWSRRRWSSSPRRTATRRPSRRLRYYAPVAELGPIAESAAGRGVAAARRGHAHTSRRRRTSRPSSRRLRTTRRSSSSDQSRRLRRLWKCRRRSSTRPTSRRRRICAAADVESIAEPRRRGADAGCRVRAGVEAPPEYASVGEAAPAVEPAPIPGLPPVAEFTPASKPLRLRDQMPSRCQTRAIASPLAPEQWVPEPVVEEVQTVDCARLRTHARDGAAVRDRVRASWSRCHSSRRWSRRSLSRRLFQLPLSSSMLASRSPGWTKSGCLTPSS